MKRVFEFTINSIVKVETTQLWQAITNMQGINYELVPLVSMTVPKEYRELTIEDAPIGEKLFRSVILLFQFIPVDLHHFKLEKVVPNERFEENSTSLMHYFWKHTRILRTVDNGTSVTDTIQFYPRLPLIGFLLKPIYQFIFKRRHQRLSKKYNTYDLEPLK